MPRVSNSIKYRFISVVAAILFIGVVSTSIALCRKQVQVISTSKNAPAAPATNKLSPAHNTSSSSTSQGPTSAASSTQSSQSQINLNRQIAAADFAAAAELQRCNSINTTAYNTYQTVVSNEAAFIAREEEETVKYGFTNDETTAADNYAHAISGNAVYAAFNTYTSSIVDQKCTPAITRNPGPYILPAGSLTLPVDYPNLVPYIN